MAVKSPAKIRRKVWSMVQKVPVLPMPALHKESAEDSQETPKKEGGTKKTLCVY
jgi:MOSC domain-containing protein YiiM